MSVSSVFPFQRKKPKTTTRKRDRTTDTPRGYSTNDRLPFFFPLLPPVPWWDRGSSVEIKTGENQCTYTFSGRSRTPVVDRVRPKDENLSRWIRSTRVERLQGHLDLWRIDYYRQTTLFRIVLKDRTVDFWPDVTNIIEYKREKGRTMSKVLRVKLKSWTGGYSTTGVTIERYRFETLKRDLKLGHGLRDGDDR